MSDAATRQGIESFSFPHEEPQVDKQQRRVVGLFWQILILTKKNFLLARRNVVGTLGEILVAILFVIIILLMRYITDVASFSDQTNIPTNSSSSSPATNFNRINYVVRNVNLSKDFIPIIYFYPDNSFVKNLTRDAIKIIEAQQPLFNATSKDCRINQILK